MKKLINRPEAVVAELVEGLEALHPGLRKLRGRNVLVRADAAGAKADRVALISGGGSGHEPAHAGYVGRGMLSGAVAGDVFTSPSPDAVLAAIRATAGPKGAVLIVKNYTGDRLNFGLAAEHARGLGIPVEIVVVADDVALAASGDNAGRRGLAGTVLVHKVAGAAAEAGLSLAEVAAEARAAAAAVRTMGVALGPCTVPAAGRPGFQLGETEIELGLGIHGEPGVRRGPIEPADALVDHLLDAILTDLPHAPGDRVALLVNDLGGTAVMELAIVARHALNVLEGRGLIVERAYSGTFLSALEMPGVSLSVLPLDDARLARLDAPTAAPAWPNAAATPRRPRTEPAHEPEPDAEPPRSAGPPRTPVGRGLDKAIRTVFGAWLNAESALNDLDQQVGDGDLGTSLARGARAVESSLPTLPLDDPSEALRLLGVTLQRSLGGTTGPLLAVLALRMGAVLKGSRTDDPKSWAAALRAGADALAALGGASAGDRTLLDALLPAASALSSALDAGQDVSSALRAAAAAAAAGADATAAMLPRRGRSSYLGARALGHPDPGALALALAFQVLAGEGH
ncbi:MAG TPA: dihydroxyacetone kinase family protein [Isosphaeraceae bacterium]|jgi:dihydroxyacetone kinase|nr:dihydroxyacetone kinase family protein [Isosphaeraceae bacterium]